MMIYLINMMVFHGYVNNQRVCIYIYLSTNQSIYLSIYLSFYYGLSLLLVLLLLLWVILLIVIIPNHNQYHFSPVAPAPRRHLRRAWDFPRRRRGRLGAGPRRPCGCSRCHQPPPVDPGAINQRMGCQYILCIYISCMYTVYVYVYIYMYVYYLQDIFMYMRIYIYRYELINALYNAPQLMLAICIHIYQLWLIYSSASGHIQPLLVNQIN